MAYMAAPSLTAARPDQRSAGFTIVELMLSLCITTIIGVAVVMAYQTHNKTYMIQREMAQMQQDLRAAMFVLQNDIRNCGRDPERSGRYGIQSIIRSNNDTDDANGYAELTMTRLVDEDGDGMADPETMEIFSYQVMDQDGDGRRELRRCTNGVCANPDDWQLLADGIEDIGFAYAYDNGNDDLARFNNNDDGPEIWGFDSDNSNTLNASIDSNGDGNIDVNDDPGGATLNPAISLDRIRVVRIWLLGRSKKYDANFLDTNTYYLGSKTLDMKLPANNDRRHYRHWLLTSVVALQNYQLDPNL